MSPSPSDEAGRELEQSLRHLRNALSTPTRTAPAPSAPAKLTIAGASGVGLAISVALIAVAIATGNPLVIIAAVVLLISSAVGLFGSSISRILGGGPADPLRPRIGMGATVAADATIEPGATVGAGASVGQGANVRRGANVRSGSNVGAGAVIEENAVVSWGASVGAGAVVGAGAAISAGASVGKNARVPPGMRVMPGSTWSGRDSGMLPAAPAAPKDPRAEKIDALCARIEAELTQSSEAVRSFLSADAGTVGALRKSCHDLLEREHRLRAEAAPESLAALDRERFALQQRVDASTDPAVRQSLEGAVAAIDDQRRQRELLARQADRIDAELTRLLWTLDSMGAALVRVRGAGVDIAAPEGEVLGSVKHLQEEIEAIAGALEGLAVEDRRAFDAVGQPLPGERERP